ncbi:transporter substrate-binding domain-containing protein [Arcanobacterium haemolyticum]|nr:transporter substrate-binding domain-containing protein [Arcanobacterium haemolyticum]
MKNRKFILPTVFTALTLALGACGAGNSASHTDAAPSSTESVSAEEARANLLEEGVLRIGTEGTYAPFTFHDSEGKLTGYDIDIIEAVADKLGVTTEYSEVKWDGIFAGLEAGRYDVVANQVAVTDEREALYDFSTKYAVSSPVVIVKSDNSSITSQADVSGKKSAQSVTSNWAELATSLGANVVGVDGFTEAVAALRDGRVDLTVNDNLAALEYFTTTNDNSVKIAFEIPGQESRQAFAFRKNSGLNEVISQTLAELEADGTIARIGSQYFGTDISK